MIDQKLYEAINKNNKIEHKKYVKELKKKGRRDTIFIITGVLSIITLVLILGIQVHQDTLKYVDKCLKSGQTKEYCLYQANR